MNPDCQSFYSIARALPQIAPPAAAAAAPAAAAAVHCLSPVPRETLVRLLLLLPGAGEKLPGMSNFRAFASNHCSNKPRARRGAVSHSLRALSPLECSLVLPLSRSLARSPIRNVCEALSRGITGAASTSDAKSA